MLKLTEVDRIELLDKRGYLTVCISLLKDGKIYLRRPEGIREWFTALQVNISPWPCIAVHIRVESSLSQSREYAIGTIGG